MVIRGVAFPAGRVVGSPEGGGRETQLGAAGGRKRRIFKGAGPSGAEPGVPQPAGTLAQAHARLWPLSQPGGAAPCTTCPRSTLPCGRSVTKMSADVRKVRSRGRRDRGCRAGDPGALHHLLAVAEAEFRQRETVRREDRDKEKRKRRPRDRLTRTARHSQKRRET